MIRRRSDAFILDLHRDSQAIQWRIMWFEADDCGSVANNLVSFADNVV
jgi:hypothetical protein